MINIVQEITKELAQKISNDPSAVKILSNGGHTEIETIENEDGSLTIKAVVKEKDGENK